jgi:single-stranded DNA-binding protein
MILNVFLVVRISQSSVLLNASDAVVSFFLAAVNRTNMNNDKHYVASEACVLV